MSTKGNGYGQINLSAIGRWSTHVLAYVLVHGPVPVGMHLDHTCHNGDLSCPGGNTCRHRLCCNPAHLEPSTPKDNGLRAAVPRERAYNERCPHGHVIDGVKVRKSGPKAGKTERYCKECYRITNRRRKTSLSTSG